MGVDSVLRQIADWRDHKLWGAPAIAQFAGVSEETIPNWAALPDCPISKCAGRYFTTRGALQTWMTRKAEQ